jgi:ferredoxin
MAYIIAEPCIGTKDTACVDVCPVDCIHPAKGRTYDDGRPTFDEVPQLYIDPTECIDCDACVPVCPVTAIFVMDDLPEKWDAYIEINKNYVEGGKFQSDKYQKTGGWRQASALRLARMSTLREIISENVREGELYEKLDRDRVRCFACGHCCPIPDGQPGVCKVRYDRGGGLFQQKR